MSDSSRFKKLVAAALLITAATPAFAGDNGKKYVVATSADFPPLSYRSSDSNQIVGFEIDMIKALSKHGSWSYDLKTSNFNGLLPSLKSGRVDMVVSDIYNTAERRKSVDFVNYLKNGFAIMVTKRNADAIGGYEDLCGKRVGVLTGSAPELDAIKKASQKHCESQGQDAIQLKSYPAVAQEIPQLANGRLAGIFETLTSLAYAQKQKEGQFEIAFRDPHTTNVGIAVRKDSAVTDQLRKDMAWYMQSSQAEANAKKWGIPASALAR
ncbi:ABC transporter substrate-binding protein [Salinisphaera sp. SPP-AMP-43]|uniref:ABC transporter substrate-binding protein n=1 Tax=Salinisphaera sp. SPP-AMP-43 TaxID=3121288 RepID=UPI003C6E8AE3